MKQLGHLSFKVGGESEHNSSFYRKTFLSNISNKILSFFYFPIPLYIYHLIEKYKSSRIHSWNRLLTFAYDDLKPLEILMSYISVPG